MKKIYVLIFIIVANISNVHAAYFESSEEVESGVTVEYDDFKKLTSYAGPVIRIMRPGNYYWHEIFLRAYKKDGGVPKDFQIYVDTHYTASRYINYGRSFDDKGTRLPLSKIDHDVVSCRGSNECIFEEVFTIDVNKSYLKSREKAEEVRYKVEGVSDYLTFGIDGLYIKGFLNAISNKKKPSE